MITATFPDSGVVTFRDEIAERFRSSGQIRLLEVQIDEDEGHVVLSGRVPTYYLKQLAQTIAGNVEGVASLRNEMVVGRTLDVPRPSL